jgi:hypothetical protein
MEIAGRAVQTLRPLHDDVGTHGRAAATAPGNRHFAAARPGTTMEECRT